MGGDALQLRHPETFGLCTFIPSNTSRFLRFRDTIPLVLGVKPGGGNRAEEMGKNRLATQKPNPAFNACVKSPRREEAAAQSLLHLNIRLFCRVAPWGRWHHDTDTRLSPSCYICRRRNSSELLVAAQLAKVEPTSPRLRGAFTWCRAMPQEAAGALSTGVPRGLRGGWLSQ